MDENCSLMTKYVKVCSLVRDITNIRGWQQDGMEQQLNVSLGKPKELGGKTFPFANTLTASFSDVTYN